MSYMEFLEALVNAQTEDERMALVKEHAEKFVENGNADSAKMDELVKQNEALTKQVADYKQEIKDRFFGKFKGNNSNESEKSEESEDDSEKTLADLGFGKKSY